MLFVALAAAEPAGEPGLLVATDNDMAASVRLVETSDAVRFVFTAPDFVVPGVSIDVYRNGVIDRDIDFEVTFQDDGSPCLTMLLAETKSSTCRPLGHKAQLDRRGQGAATITTFTFPKQEISGDGFGFGFAIELWNSKGDYGSSLAGGDYRFGGFMHLVENGPNFRGQGRPQFPPEIMPALHRYQGCINRSMTALGPIDKSKLPQLRAVTAGCVAARSTALGEGVSALVVAGRQKDMATQLMGDALDQVDNGTAKLIEIAEKLSRARHARGKHNR